MQKRHRHPSKALRRNGRAKTAAPNSRCTAKY